MNLSYKKQLNISFNAAVEKIKSELGKHGFGVIMEIDVKGTMKKKLNVDFENYIILGACKPQSALEVLSVDKEMGLLLPCNIIVYEDQEEVYASTILPTALSGFAGNDSFNRLAEEAEDALKKVIENL